MQAPIDPTRRALLQGLLGAALLPASNLIAASSDAESLHTLEAAKGILFGSEIGLEALDDPRNTRLIDHECAIVVAQNEFKLYSILAAGEKQYSFTGGAAGAHRYAWHRKSYQHATDTFRSRSLAGVPVRRGGYGLVHGCDGV